MKSRENRENFENILKVKHTANLKSYKKNPYMKIFLLKCLTYENV